MVMVTQLGGGNEREGFRLLALLVSAAFLIAEVICCLTLKENTQQKADSSSGIREMFRELFRNDQALTVTGTIVLINVSAYITSNLIIYFFKYDYGGEAWKAGYTVFIGAGSVSLVLGMILLYPLLRRKKVPNEKIFKLGIAVAVAGYLMMLAVCLPGPSGRLAPLCVAGCMVFLANGILTVLTTVFLANSVDYGELLTRHRNESMTFSMQTFVVKTASGLAIFISGIGLDLIGLAGNAEETGEVIPQSADTLLGLRLLMNLLPILGLAAAFLCFRKWFRLTDRRMEEISEQLKSVSARESAKS